MELGVHSILDGLRLLLGVVVVFGGLAVLSALAVRDLRRKKAGAVRPEPSELSNSSSTVAAPSPLLSPDELQAGRRSVSPAILAQLQNCEIVDHKCLNCGYDGPMCLERVERPWWGSWWILVPICATGIGLIAVALIAINVNLSTKDHLRCPNCAAAAVRLRGRI